MNSLLRNGLALVLVKVAHEEPVNPWTAAVTGALGGPLGASVYEQTHISEPSDRWGIVGRSAVGGALGSGIGWLAGVPVMLSTGVPILPGLAGSLLGGSIGSGIGAYRGAREFNAMLGRHHDQLSKKKEEHDEHRP
jgi:hypothetical protein